MYDLRSEKWLLLRRQSGRLEQARVADILVAVHEDPVLSLASPRPEFDGAVLEFLVGILSAALTPSSEREWRAWWDVPPSPDDLQGRLDDLPDAFCLDGDGFRFLQDHVAEDFTETENLPINRLYFDTPGDQTIKLNRDHFIKRTDPEGASYPVAAMALIAMQTYAPPGGQGHRTSMRGGGPLTTLVDPRSGQEAEGPLSASLWRFLWANVETIDQWVRRTSDEVSDVPGNLFPWMQNTRTSERDGGRTTTPLDAHPLQAYFGMPRRIRLDFSGAGTCGVTGMLCEQTVSGFRTRNYGVKYDAWRHPLSPYYRQKPGSEPLPVHPQPDGLAWSDWVGLLARDAAGRVEPAQAVGHFIAVRAPSLRISRASVRAFGIDFDNMKCRGWLDARLPIFVCAEATHQQVLFDTARMLTKAADLVLYYLIANVKGALFPAGADIPRDYFTQARREFWDGTSSAFYSALEQLAQGGLDEERSLAARKGFVPALSDAALEVFDSWCPLDVTAPDMLRRVVRARYRLMGAFNPGTKAGAALLGELSLPVTRNEKPTRKTARRAQKEN